jgi:uncharacterized protein YegL
MPAEKVTSTSPWHVVLIIDDSGSMGPEANVRGGPTPASQVNEGLRSMVAEMEVIAKGTKPYFRVSIIAFGSNSEIIAEAKSERDIDIDRIATFAGSRGSTKPSHAFRLAEELLRRNPGAPTDFRPYVFFFSDGVPDNDDRLPAFEAAANLKSLNIAAGQPTIWTFGYGNIDRKFMKQVATSEFFKEVPDAHALARLFPVIGTSATSGGPKTGESAVNIAIMNY